MLLGSAPWPLKENNVTIIGRYDAVMVRWMCHVKLDEYHERMFAKSKTAMVWSSIKNGRESLA